MLKGLMILRVSDGNNLRSIVIEEGQSFLLPGNIPHSPQRLPNTIGLVIEREREHSEDDGLRWYCPNKECRNILHTYWFRCEDLGSQLKTLIEEWYDEKNKELRTCKKCGAIETRIKPSLSEEIYKSA